MADRGVAESFPASGSLVNLLIVSVQCIRSDIANTPGATYVVEPDYGVKQTTIEAFNIVTWNVTGENVEKNGLERIFVLKHIRSSLQM